MADRGKELHAARRRKRMSQEHLATVAGVSVRTVRRAERGEDISDESLRCLCATLGLQAEDADAQSELGMVQGAITMTVESDRCRPESVEAAFSDRAARTVEVLVYYPALTIGTASLLALFGSWPGIGVMSLGFLLLHLLVAKTAALALPMGVRHMDGPSAAILAGAAYIALSTLWLIHFGAGSPRLLQVVVIGEMTAGFVMAFIGVQARHEQWLAQALADCGDEA